MSVEEYWSKRNYEWFSHGYGFLGVEKFSEKLLLRSIVSRHFGRGKNFIDIGSGVFENQDIFSHYYHNILTERFVSSSMGIARLKHIHNVSIVYVMQANYPLRIKVLI